MTAKLKALLSKDADPAFHILRKLAAKEPNTRPLFNALLRSQLRSRLSNRESMVIASEITLSRFRQQRSLKNMFANRDDFANSFLLQLVRTTAFPAEDLRPFFDTVLHAQGLDAYAQSAKQQYQQARAQLESVLVTLTPQKGESSLAQAGKAQIALTTTLSSIKTAKAKLARSFSSIPKDFVFLLLPLYRQWVKTVGNAPKAKRTFLNAISWALIERQISTLALPKEARIKRIQALRSYLKTSGMLDKVWLALKLANLSFGQQAPNKGTLTQVATIYHECETIYTEFELLQQRIQNTIHLCHSLKELYANDLIQARLLVQYTVNIHSQYIACTKFMGSSILNLSQVQRKIDSLHGSLDEIMSAILNHKSSAYSRTFMQGVWDFAHLVIQKRWIEALHCLFTAPPRDAKELAILSKNPTLAQELTNQDSAWQTREIKSQQSQSESQGNTSNVVNLFDHAVVIETQFTQSKKTTPKDQDNQQPKEAAVFAPKYKT